MRWVMSGKGGLVIYGVCLVTSGEPVGLILEKGLDADCREFLRSQTLLRTEESPLKI